MDHVLKKYWTAPLPSSRMNVAREAASGDAAGMRLKIDLTGADVGLSEALRGKVKVLRLRTGFRLHFVQTVSPFGLVAVVVVDSLAAGRN